MAAFLDRWSKVLLKRAANIRSVSWGFPRILWNLNDSSLDDSRALLSEELPAPPQYFPLTHQDLPHPYCSAQTANSTCTQGGYSGTHLWPQWSGSRFGRFIHWRLGGRRSWSGRFGEENNLFSWIEPRFLGLATLTLNTLLTTDNLVASCTGPRSKMAV